MRRIKEIFSNGLIKHNPIFVMLIGLCPTLAVTTCAVNGVSMGIATLFVLIISNSVISLLCKFIPSRIRVGAYIIIIAGFSTAVDLLLQAYLPTVSNALGLYVPLIAVNCLIFARADAFASKNAPLASLLDGLAMGLGFTAALTLVGIIRELIGSGSVFGIDLFGRYFSLPVFLMPTGAFLTLGFLLALFQKIRAANKKHAKGGDSR